MATLFDESATDLIDRADRAALEWAMRRYKSAPHGFRKSRLRALQMEVLRQLSRTNPQ